MYREMAAIEVFIIGILIGLIAVHIDGRISPHYVLPLDALTLEYYGHWCGWNRTGISPWAQPGYCDCKTNTLQECLPPYDTLDRACAARDYCTRCIERPSHLDFNWCECEKPFFEMVDDTKCNTENCVAYRKKLLKVYKEMPCYCRWLGKSCTKKGDKEPVYCSQQNSLMKTC